MPGNASSNTRTVADVRRDLEAQREQLAGEAESLRETLSEATDITGKLRANLPAAAVGALCIGFFFAGGVGATARLIFRKGREGEIKAAVGPFFLVERE
ncbi:MAG TPA: hypothetical protein VIZ44_07860 [Gaiellaceae bacterium]